MFDWAQLLQSGLMNDQGSSSGMPPMGALGAATGGGGMGFLQMLQGAMQPASQGPNSVDEAASQGAPMDAGGLPKLSPLPQGQVDDKIGLPGRFSQAAGKLGDSMMTSTSATQQRMSPGPAASAPRPQSFTPPPFTAPGMHQAPMPGQRPGMQGAGGIGSRPPFLPAR